MIRWITAPYSRAVIVVTCTVLLVAVSAATTRGGMTPLPADVRVLADGNLEFALDLYSRLASSSDNIVVSPLSLSTCLGMVYAGARGRTASEMADVLRFELPPESVHRSFGILRERFVELNDSADTDLTFANGLWIQADHDRITPAYRELVMEHYAAAVRHADFRDHPQRARGEINDWIAEQSSGTIPGFLDEGWPSGAPHIVLASVVYFNGQWVHEFPTALTRDAPFYASNGDTLTVSMMCQTEPFRYFEDDRVQVIEILYRGGSASMLVVLPKRGVGLAEVSETLTHDSLDQWTVAMESREVRVRLPRFVVRSTFSRLVDTLASMGMRDVFSLERSDLSGMTDIAGGHCVSSIAQGAFIEVNERGTRAGAVTLAEETIGLSTRIPPEFRADRPFLFFVRDRLTGSVLFMGRLERPES